MAKILKHVLISEEIIPLGITPILQSSTQEIQQNTMSEECYQKGYEQGLQDGALKMQECHSARNTQLEALLLALPAALETHQAEMNSHIAEYVLAIVSQLFIQHCSTPKYIEDQINHMVHNLNPQDMIEVHLHPQDIVLLQQKAIHCHLPSGIKIKSDASLTLGGCIIKTKQGTLNSSIEQQIEHLKQALFDLKQGGTHAPII